MKTCVRKSHKRIGENALIASGRNGWKVHGSKERWINGSTWWCDFMKLIQPSLFLYLAVPHCPSKWQDSVQSLMSLLSMICPLKCWHGCEIPFPQKWNQIGHYPVRRRSKTFGQFWHMNSSSCTQTFPTAYPLTMLIQEWLFHISTRYMKVNFCSVPSHCFQSIV